MQDERKKIEIERNKKNNEERMKLKQREAKAAIDLMKHTYERIVREENQQNGLIINRAIYGVLAEDSNEFRPESSIDVTIPLQCLVKESSLILYNASKSDLPGFYDPCYDNDKVQITIFKNGFKI